MSRNWEKRKYTLDVAIPNQACLVVGVAVCSALEESKKNSFIKLFENGWYRVHDAPARGVFFYLFLKTKEAKQMKSAFEMLQERGFIQQLSHEEEIKAPQNRNVISR